MRADPREWSKDNDLTIFPDVEVIARSSEAAIIVIFRKLLDRVVGRHFAGAAVQNNRVNLAFWIDELNQHFGPPDDGGRHLYGNHCRHRLNLRPL